MAVILGSCYAFRLPVRFFGEKRCSFAVIIYFARTLFVTQHAFLRNMNDLALKNGKIKFCTFSANSPLTPESKLLLTLFLFLYVSEIDAYGRSRSKSFIGNTDEQIFDLALMTRPSEFQIRRIRLH